MKKKLLFVTLFAAQSLLQADYTLVNAHRHSSRIDHMPKGKIADMWQIPQDPAFYAKQLKPVSYSKQLKWDKEYNEKYFRPWSLNQIDLPLKEMKWPFRSVRKKKIYTSKGRVISSSIYEQWIANANFGKLDTAHQRGITTRHVNVRALPTIYSFYHNPKKVGEGFPFDYNQNTSYHLNTPLYISHYSLDGKWAYVRGSAAYGWIKTSGMAVVDDAFIKRFKNNHYAIAIRDNLKLYHQKKYLSPIKLGTIFPIAKRQKDQKSDAYLFAFRGKNGKAVLRTADKVKPGLIAKKPIPMTPKNTAMIAKQFYNEPYGWGGLLETRDCSSFTKDYFAPFGIFLRRNSSKQARDGDYSNIRGIPKNKKKQAIISTAKPFRSMPYVRS
ncbi:MAG TPA: glycoside hydrolase, partial [Epsilonproteobacteria bacterium]|nr:glycoside hydrolase [Campylobacterota bacterium]